MRNFLVKNYLLFGILKFIILTLSVINVFYYKAEYKQIFNQFITEESTRFAIGKVIILMMAIHIILELISLQNLFSFYKTKYVFTNFILGIISIAIALPLLYNFWDDFQYYSGKVSPFAFVMPMLYFVSGIFDFAVMGKSFKK